MSSAQSGEKNWVITVKKWSVKRFAPEKRKRERELFKRGITLEDGEDRKFTCTNGDGWFSWRSRLNDITRRYMFHLHPLQFRFDLSRAFVCVSQPTSFSTRTLSTTSYLFTFARLLLFSLGSSFLPAARGIFQINKIVWSLWRICKLYHTYLTVILLAFPIRSKNLFCINLILLMHISYMDYTSYHLSLKNADSLLLSSHFICF